MKVAEIIPIDKKKSKIVIAGMEPFSLYNGEIRRYGISEGDDLPESIYQNIVEEVLKKRVKERTLYLLKDRDRAENDIRMKLKRGYYPQEVIDYGIEFLKKYGYVDDRRYVENYIHENQRRKSRQLITQSLILKGISKDMIREVFDSMEETQQENQEQQMIYRLLEKKKYDYGQTDYKEKNKIMAFLVRKGFEMEDIQYCMKNPQESNV
ncbi:MAG: regulatory protein RecX [Lachnospiraceae bacterium]|nr:regulatory protein RecX [Lachnospiraceae bacterium]